jgi:hypothetical protein
MLEPKEEDIEQGTYGEESTRPRTSRITAPAPETPKKTPTFPLEEYQYLESDQESVRTGEAGSGGSTKTIR